MQRRAEAPDPRITLDTAGLDPKATELSNLLALKIRGLSRRSLEDLILKVRAAAARDGV